MKEVENASAVAPAGTLAEIARKYLDAYQGRDSSRYHRINAWIRLLGEKVLIEITPDNIDNAMCTLATEPSRVYNGRDIDDNPIFKAKGGLRSGATARR